jgi:hypothetical protein
MFNNDKAYFQQDGPTAHIAHMAMVLLDDVFADRIISKTIWPPRSPDLFPPDFFFLWGAMKNSVCSNNPHTIDDLKMAITEYIRNVDRAILNTVFENTDWCVNKFDSINSVVLVTILFFNYRKTQQSLQ